MLMVCTIDQHRRQNIPREAPAHPAPVWNLACTAQNEDLQSAHTADTLMAADLQLPIFDLPVADAIWHGGCPGPCILHAVPEALSRPVYSMWGVKSVNLGHSSGTLRWARHRPVDPPRQPCSYPMYSNQALAPRVRAYSVPDARACDFLPS